MTSLRSLCGINLSILSQKLGLMEALVTTHGRDSALDLYKSTCPLVKATIGQHIRHSMDHMELAILVADTYPYGPKETNTSSPEIHYDLRVRGGTLEHDMEEATKRIVNLSDILKDLSETSSSDDLTQPVQAHFMLSGDGNEFSLPSTIHRELGFCAHHAIHHMAMIRLIAENHIGLTNLPADFGRAPSTVHHDLQQDSK
mmetsp:Transcript_16663/g.27623  ORF Transcript_16663/g.27623 Transcript_16663/m.27623 type:complete len:200 (+) Transcript_16663:220-819(+)|eukprot:CAMPEP_0119022310 /NCGR_PEP_ID=MMETSP1176-20130426/27709_1 /TAXON_ID=265551 /ORGANISM="Synedropsis recta cf, Strain CCMP1620" /LENGTH=199 /DNA_ID=CAMNT_0006977115 /DNA_START=144 /DNA_END=743 /DNA_ORIENTATION=+